MSFPDRLRQLLQENPSKSKAGLARHVGIKPPSVSGWVSGETKIPDGNNILRAADYFGVRPEWLATGKGAKTINALEANVNVTPAPIGGVRIPLISYVQAGIWTEIVDNFQPGDADEWLLTDLLVSGGTFALEIQGNSMLPKFEPGDRVIIDPDVAPSPGDFVVAKNGEEEATFKKYRPRGIDAQGTTVFELVPLNDDFATIRSDLQPIQIIGTMVEHRQYRRAR